MPGRNDSEIRLLRLAAQHIGSEAFDSPVAVVTHLLAMQAQDYAGVKWGIGLRATGVDDLAVERAIADREIVRSWPMRGTLHFVPAEDLGWMLGLTGNRIVASAAGRHRNLGLEPEHFSRAAAIAEKLMANDTVVPRSDLFAAFTAGGLDVTQQRGPHLLVYLSVTGRIVYGPVAGKQHTFAQLDTWVRNPRKLEGDEALAEFVLRYFVSHGPATDRDFAWWSSLTLTDARRGLSAVSGQLESFDHDGRTLWHAPGLEPASPGIHVLPGFDEFVLGYQDRRPQVSAENFARIVPGGNGMFLSTIVVDGEVVGTWRRTASAKKVVVELTPFTRLSARARRQVENALDGYGRFVGLPVSVTWSSLAPGTTP
jgi:hypothetical protein